MKVFEGDCLHELALLITASNDFFKSQPISMQKQAKKTSRWKSSWHLFFWMTLLGCNTNAQADEEIEELIVLGRAINAPDLSATSRAGSRLGLSVLDTPASIELIDSSVMRARGYKSVSDAVKSLPGVLSGESPAAPSTFFNEGV